MWFKCWYQVCKNCSDKLFYSCFFSYGDLQVSPTSVGLSGNDTINVTVTLENLSKYSADEVSFHKPNFNFENWVTQSVGFSILQCKSELFQRYQCQFLQVVQVYVSWTNSRKSAGFRLPNLQLVAFSRVTVPANNHVQVHMSFKTSVLNVWFDNVGFKLLPGG